MLRRLQTFLKVVSEVLAQIAAVALGVLTTFVVLSALMRYFLGQPFNFTEELVGFLFLATVFLVFPQVTIRQEHIAVPLVVNLLPPRGQRIAKALAAAVMTVFGGWFALESWKFTAFSFEIGARSQQLQLPVGIWQVVMPFGMGMLAIISFVGVIAHLLGEPSQDASPEDMKP